MTSGFARWVMAAAAVAGALALAAGLFPPTTAAAQPPQPADPDQCPDPARLREKEEPATSATACKDCHGRSKADVKDSRFAKAYGSNTFVLLTEGGTWEQEDPHSAALRVLDEPLGQQMARLLKDNPAFKNGVKTAPQCLTCHAVDIKPWLPLEKKTGDDFFANPKQGITCNGCHGLRPGWQSPHYAPDKNDEYIPWRVKTPAEKEAAGLRTLRDPAVRAAFCATCHVGSACEGKVVTHEMYAAGHPPLPPFELGTFMECQPKHWGYPTDPSLEYFTDKGVEAYGKTSGKKIPDTWRWDLYRFHPPAKEAFIARSVVAGAVASLQAEMRMLAADAAAPKDGGIDFARFDCYACHHDLKLPSARQERGYDGHPPGRPPMKAWLAALPGVVADHAAGLAPLAETAKEFHGKWAAVRTAAMARPFGDPKEVKAKADEMAQWCDEFLKKSGAGGQPLYTDAETKRLMGAIADAATSKRWLGDPEATMHLTWAYLSLRHNGRPNWDDPAVKQLEEVVPVRVRTGDFSRNNLPVAASESIGRRLDLFGDFKAADFTKRFNALQKK